MTGSSQILHLGNPPATEVKYSQTHDVLDDCTAVTLSEEEISITIGATLEVLTAELVAELEAELDAELEAELEAEFDKADDK